jgi:hypothetical protein
LSLSHNAFADAVVDVVGEAPLFAREPLQAAFGPLSALLLQLLPESPVAVSDRVEVLARVGLAIRVGGDVDDAQVYSQKAVREKRGCGGAIIPRTFSPWDTWTPPRPPEADIA